MVFLAGQPMDPNILWIRGPKPNYWAGPPFVLAFYGSRDQVARAATSLNVAPPEGRNKVKKCQPGNSKGTRVRSGRRGRVCIPAVADRVSTARILPGDVNQEATTRVAGAAAHGPRADGLFFGLNSANTVQFVSSNRSRFYCCVNLDRHLKRIHYKTDTMLTSAPSFASNLFPLDRF